MVVTVLTFRSFVSCIVICNLSRKFAVKKIDDWLSERAEVDYVSFTSLAALHADFCAWAVKRKTVATGKKALSGALVTKGLVPHRTAGARGFLGLKLAG